MVRKDLTSKDRVLALRDLLRNGLSQSFQTRSTLADVNAYVERVQEFLGRDSHYPEKSSMFRLGRVGHTPETPPD